MDFSTDGILELVPQNFLSFQEGAVFSSLSKALASRPAVPSKKHPAQNFALFPLISICTQTLLHSRYLSFNLITMRLLSTLLAIIPLILTILSFIFTVLSTTSKQWAYQDFYAEPGVVISLDQAITPLWTIYRSPFWTCGRGANATSTPPKVLPSTKTKTNEIKN
jgi:hypothetical protein